MSRIILFFGKHFCHYNRPKNGRMVSSDFGNAVSDNTASISHTRVIFDCEQSIAVQVIVLSFVGIYGGSCSEYVSSLFMIFSTSILERDSRLSLSDQGI